MVQSQIDACRRRRDDGHLRAVFDAYKADILSKDSLREALIKLGVAAAKGEAFDEIFLEFDLDRDGQIDFEEFKAAVRRPSPLESWCKSVDWWQAVADAIPPGDDNHHPLRAIASRTDGRNLRGSSEIHQRNPRRESKPTERRIQGYG